MAENLYLQNPDFEGLTRPGGWTRDTHTGQAYGEIFVPEGWVAFWEEDTYRRPEVKVIPRQAPFLDPPRIHRGEWAVQMFTYYGRMHAGLYQIVTGLTPGRVYEFSIQAHAWSTTPGLEGEHDAHCSAGVGCGPVYILPEDVPPLNGDPSNDAIGNFVFQVGVSFGDKPDPFGNLNWCSGACIYNAYHKVPPIRFTAPQGGEVVVYVKATSLWGFRNSDIYLDDAELVAIDEPPVPPLYKSTMLVLPQTATPEQLQEIFTLAYPDRRTFGFSNDDAGVLGGTTILYNISNVDKQAYLDFYATRYPDVKVEFAYTSDWEEPPSELLLWQCDPRWKDEKIASPGCSGTLCQLGCWIAACAMAQRFFGIKSDATPSTANQALGDALGFSGCMTLWTPMKEALGLEVVKQCYDEQEVREWLDTGNVCFAEVEPQTFMHFVMVTKYQEGRFWMHDPWKNITGWLDEYYPGVDSWRSICPFDAPPPDTAHSKLGPHILRLSGRIGEYLSSGVAVAKFVGDWGAATNVPDSALVIGRRHQGDYDAQHQRASGMSPLEAAQQFVQDQLPTYQANPHIKYWEGHNEPVWNDEDGMGWYARFEAERMQLMANLGLKCVIGNFAAGTPPLHLWPAFLPALRVARQYEAILGLHEYSCPWMWWMTGAYQIDPNEDEGDEGWTTLRYRKVYRQHLAPNGVGDVPLVITECGIDPLVNPKPPGCDGGTWKQLGDYWAENDGEPDKADYYYQQLVWYDEELQKDNYVVGATIFTWGSFGLPFSDFDVAETPVQDKLIAYAQANPAKPFEYPNGDPPPPPPPDFTLRGVHDECGAEWLRDEGLSGWCVIACYLGTSPRQLDLREYADAGIRVILRLSYSYATDDGGAGTMPPPDNLQAHEDAIVRTMELNPSAWGFVYGNEPNNLREWPRDFAITPEYYRDSYNRVWTRKPTGARLSPCSLDPYNAGWGDWRETWAWVLNTITGCDFLALHAYTHGPELYKITHDKQFEDAPLIGVFYDLRVLESQQAIVPTRFAGLPQIVTETNHYVRHDSSVGWEPDAGEWVSEAYKYFGQQGMVGATLFRHGYEQWRYGDLPNVLEALRGV